MDRTRSLLLNRLSSLFSADIFVTIEVEEDGNLSSCLHALLCRRKDIFISQVYCKPTHTLYDSNAAVETSSATSYANDLEQRLLLASKGSILPSGFGSIPLATSAYFPPDFRLQLQQYPFLSPFVTNLTDCASGLFVFPQYGTGGNPLNSLGMAGSKSQLPRVPLNNSQTPTTKKKGRWCAMHVQIAWDIYNRIKCSEYGSGRAAQDSAAAAALLDHQQHAKNQAPFSFRKWYFLRSVGAGLCSAAILWLSEILDKDDIYIYKDEQLVNKNDKITDN
ncbi:unnamed protein product [Soboliphyme baturini]|uniref:Uncharacterized protein n=1 Tax=Soboliphyme baturini TaxID=241478 RepID=A0A183IZX5_9BILA|nr:unnamed protein product [Soboliphyme baturini]